MAKNSVRDYSATNSANTDIQSIDIDENCSPSGINNAIREVMVDLKNVSTGAVALETPSADQLNVDNLRLDGNTISSTDTNGNISLSPNGTGDTIFASGNVGIGTASPSSKLDVAVTDTGSIQEGLTIKGTQTGGYGGYLGWKDSWSGDAYSGYRGAIIADVPSANAGRMRFFTASGGSLSETMRIDNSGNVVVGKSGLSTTTAGHEFRSNGLAIHTVSGNTVMEIVRTTNTGVLVGFNYVGTAVGSISTNGSSTSYNTSSDYRLKENVTATWDATTRLKQLNPVRFNFIADADTTVDGFLAHEAQAVVPESVTGTKDAVDDDGNPVYQGIDQAKLVPLLVKTIQELEARVTALEAN